MTAVHDTARRKPRCQVAQLLLGRELTGLDTRFLLGAQPARARWAVSGRPGGCLPLKQPRWAETWSTTFYWSQGKTLAISARASNWRTGQGRHRDPALGGLAAAHAGSTKVTNAIVSCFLLQSAQHHHHHHRPISCRLSQRTQPWRMKRAALLEFCAAVRTGVPCSSAPWPLTREESSWGLPLASASHPSSLACASEAFQHPRHDPKLE